MICFGLEGWRIRYSIIFWLDIFEFKGYLLSPPTYCPLVCMCYAATHEARYMCPWAILGVTLWVLFTVVLNFPPLLRDAGLVGSGRWMQHDLRVSNWNLSGL